MTLSLDGGLRRARLIAFCFPLLLSLPFLHRAFFVDDSYFVEIATWLKDHPGRPYDFRTDDAGIGNLGWERNGFVRMVNPLGQQYFLAMLLKLGRGSIAFLRFGTVFITGFGAVCVFELARRWTSSPLAATFLTCLSPPWWLTAHSLLIDSTMGALFVAALWCFIRAAEKDAVRYAVLSGILMGLCILTKYTGVLVIPLSAAWVALNLRRVRRPGTMVMAWVIALGFLIAYSGWTAALYGKPHILAASQRMVHTFGWAKVFVLFVFFAGGALVPLVSWTTATVLARLEAAAIGAGVAGLMASRLGGFTPVQAALLGLWFATALLFLWNLADLRRRGVWPRDGILIVWIFGFFAMMLCVMDWVAVRYFHIVMPAVAMAAVRLIEIRWPGRERRPLAALIGLVFVSSTALAYADYRQAAPAREIGPMLEARGFHGGERHFYLGDSFTVSYLRQYGWVPCFPQTELRPGDLVLSKEVTMPLVWFARKPLRLRLVAEFNFPSRFPVKVMDMKGAAGFYASIWGALPFTFSDGPWERFRLYEITAVGPDR